MAVEQSEELARLDTSDVDRWVGQPTGGGQLEEPVSVTDIRRWAQGMQNPNPLYLDKDFAVESALGRFAAIPAGAPDAWSPRPDVLASQW